MGGTIRYNMFCQLRQRLDDADVAQLVEQRIRNAQVVGSTPIISSSSKNYPPRFSEGFLLLKIEFHIAGEESLGR